MPGFKNMTKTERRDYLRAWRARQGKKCACGRPTTLTKWGQPVCIRCNTLENAQDLKERYRERAGGFSEYQLCYQEEYGKRDA
jgi:hypothetical protein